MVTRNNADEVDMDGAVSLWYDTIWYTLYYSRYRNSHACNTLVSFPAQ